MGWKSVRGEDIKLWPRFIEILSSGFGRCNMLTDEQMLITSRYTFLFSFFFFSFLFFFFFAVVQKKYVAVCNLLAQQVREESVIN
jgi:hypothetical protein